MKQEIIITTSDKIKLSKQQQAVKNSLSRSSKEIKEMMAGKRGKKTIEDL